MTTSLARKKGCCGNDIPESLGPAPDVKTILVAAGVLIDPDGRVLLAQRPQGKHMAGLWEFPGGKIHPGETPEYALVRELNEELGIMTCTDCLSPLTFVSHTYPEFHLLMPVFVCRTWEGTPRALEAPALAWVRPQALGDYPMPPADKPLVTAIQDMV